jgi:hypothetical protein
MDRNNGKFGSLRMHHDTLIPVTPGNDGVYRMDAFECVYLFFLALIPKFIEITTGIIKKIPEKYDV